MSNDPLENKKHGSNRLNPVESTRQGDTGVRVLHVNKNTNAGFEMRAGYCLTTPNSLNNSGLPSGGDCFLSLTSGGRVGKAWEMAGLPGVLAGDSVKFTAGIACDAMAVGVVIGVSASDMTMAGSMSGNS